MDQVLAVAAGRSRDELIWQSRTGSPMHSPGNKTWFDGAVKRMISKTAEPIAQAEKDDERNQEGLSGSHHMVCVMLLPA